MNLPTETVPIVNLMEPQQGVLQSDTALADADWVQLALAAGAIIGTWFWDIQADRFMIDEAFAIAFGLDPALGREGIPLAQIVATVHPDDQAGLAAAINEAVERGGAYAHEYRVRRHTGRYHWLEANGRVEHGPDGTPMRFSGVLIDAASRRLERILKELSERLRSLDDLREMVMTVSEAVGAALDLSRVAYIQNVLVKCDRRIRGKTKTGLAASGWDPQNAGTSALTHPGNSPTSGVNRLADYGNRPVRTISKPLDCRIVVF